MNDGGHVMSQKLPPVIMRGIWQVTWAHARFVLDAWGHDYNHVRPHSKLGGKRWLGEFEQRG